MERKPKILIDVDDVIVDGVFLDALNKFKKTNYTQDQFKTYFIEEEVLEKSEIDNFHNFLLSYDYYKDCNLVDGVSDVLPTINKYMDVYFCSSCIVKGMESKSGIFFERKYNFLLRSFPYIDPNKYIFTTSKNNFSGIDFQIDDLISNLQGNVNNKKILFTRHHNKEINDISLKDMNIVRANTWYEILSILLFYQD